MTISSLIALFAVMMVLAALPSTSVLTVVSQSIASGVSHGIATAMGIVVGDIIFIVIALLGLSVIAEAIGDLFIIIKYCAVIYLIWFGISLWKTTTQHSTIINRVDKTSILSSFFCGLFVTLGDQKAILFYMGFFPAFIELSNLSTVDISMIILITIIAVGGVKVFYALMANKSRLLFKNNRAKEFLNRFAGSTMIGTGLFIAAKS